MNLILAATSTDAPVAFIELGAVAVMLSILARIAHRLGLPGIPLYLIAGLALGKGGVAHLM